MPEVRKANGQLKAYKTRRQALEIICQLPDDPIEALKVLEYARETVERLMAEEPSLPALRLIT